MWLSRNSPISSHSVLGYGALFKLIACVTNCFTDDTMSIQHLKEIVTYGSHEAIKHWLKISGIHPHTANNEADFYKLLDKHVASGKLTSDQLRRVALEIEEYSGKRVYLGKLSNYKTFGLRQMFENHLKLLGYGIDFEPVKARQLPSKPHLNYICWSTKEVRIGFSETHELLKPDRASMTLKYVPRTNLIIISAEPLTGLIKIMMDAQGDKHPHLATYRGQEIDGYVDFYKRKGLQLLGASEFRSVDLLKIATGIVRLGPTVFEETDALERTGHNSKQRTWSRSDVRDDPAYTAGTKVDGDKRVVEGLSGTWLPEGSDGRLHRKMWMHLSRREDMVQFPAHRLASEVEYAISRIREV